MKMKALKVAKLNPDATKSERKKIRKCLEDFTECKVKKIQKGIDGCSAPQYAFPMENLAIAMINIIKSYDEKNKYNKEIKILLKDLLLILWIQMVVLM